jgi:hypothetical protein
MTSIFEASTFCFDTTDCVVTESVNTTPTWTDASANVAVRRNGFPVVIAPNSSASV